MFVHTHYPHAVTYTSATHANLVHDVTDTALSDIKSKMVMYMAVLITFECQYKMSVFTAVFTSEPVWPSGKALGWYVEGPRFNTASALLSL